MYAVIVLDGSGREVGRYDSMDDRTGLVSLGSGPEDHVPLAALPPGQVYLYVANGEMVVENPLGNGAVSLNGYAIEQPSYADPDTDIQVGPYWIRLVRLSEPPASSLRSAAGAEDLAPAAGTVSIRDVPEPVPSESGMGASVGDGYYEGAAAQVAMDLAYAPGGPATSHGPLILEGVAGLVAGKNFVLEEGKDYDVGRDGILEIPLTDPTVSRRHARLTVTEGGLSVLDLRSRNGTYVNGERIKRQVVLPGDRIRFGEVAFRLKRLEEPAGPKVAARKPAKRAKPLRRGVLAAGVAAALAVVFVVAVGVRRRLSHRKGGRDEAAAALRLARAKRQHFRRLMGEARDYLDHQRWAAAMEALQKALEDYPTLEAKRQATELLERVRREIEAQKTLEEADERFGAAGADIEALERVRALYASIPQDSYYYPRARHQQTKVSLLIARQYETRALAYNKKRSIKMLLRAQDSFCKFFEALGDVPEVVPTEARNREMLQELERYLAKRQKLRHKEFQPCRANRYLHELASGAASAGAALRRKYAYRPIADALLAYVRGRVDQGLAALVTLRSKRKAKAHLATIRLLQERLALLKGKFAEVDAALHRKDAAAAAKLFLQARRIERSVLPNGVESFALRDAAHRLAELYFQLGDEQFRLGRYPDCYGYWERGKAFEPSNPKLLNGLVKLEKEARRVLLQAQGLVSSDPQRARQLLERVRDMTSKESPLHGEAVRLLGRLSR